MEYTLNPVGKMAASEQNVRVELFPEYRDCLYGLEHYGWAIVITWLDRNDTPEARSTHRATNSHKDAPEMLGVFASRVPRRPNPIGLHVVEIKRIDEEAGIIEVDTTDAFDGTPVLDIKPYSPGGDCVENPRVPYWYVGYPNSVQESREFDWSKIKTRRWEKK